MDARNAVAQRIAGQAPGEPLRDMQKTTPNAAAR